MRHFIVQPPDETNEDADRAIVFTLWRDDLHVRFPLRSAGALMLVVLACTLLTACSLFGAGQGRYTIQVDGAVQRDLSGGQIFYEPISTGRQLYIQKMGPGDDIIVLMILMPQAPSSTSYSLSSNGPLRAEYFEAVGGVSRQFRQNVNGTLTFTQGGDLVSGTLDFTSDGLYEAAGQTIHVTGTFSNIPLAGSGVQSGGGLSGSLAGLMMLCMLTVMVLANFGFQFYVGRMVYQSEGSWVLRSLRGTRTFIRGWSIPDLRLTMIAWSIDIAGLLLFILLVVMLRGGLQ